MDARVFEACYCQPHRVGHGQHPKLKADMAQGGTRSENCLNFPCRENCWGCAVPLKIGPKKIEGKMVFWGQKDRIL